MHKEPTRSGKVRFVEELTGLRLPQAAFRDLVPGRSVQAFNGSWQRDEGGLRQEHVSKTCSCYQILMADCVGANDIDRIKWIICIISDVNKTAVPI